MQADEIRQKLVRVQKKMEQLRKRDAEQPVRNFSYLYEMNPCLSAEHIAALEQQYQISLPEEYRLFLQEIGDGSTDPQFGLFPLEEALKIQWDWEIPAYFREPFVPPDPRDDTDEHEDGWGPGLLTLEHTGCGECSYLVVSGAEYGHIWQGQVTRPSPAYTRRTRSIFPFPALFRSVSKKDILPEYHQIVSLATEERLTFLDWYDDYLG